MSIGRTFGKFSKKHHSSILGVGLASNLTTLSLTVAGFSNPFTALAIGFIAIGVVADAVLSNTKAEWKNESGQTLTSDIMLRNFIKNQESYLKDDLIGYKTAKTDKQKQKAIENFQYHLGAIELLSDDVEITSGNDISNEYCYGYEKIPKNETLSLEHLEENLLEISNKESEKPIVVGLRKKAGKFGV